MKKVLASILAVLTCISSSALCGCFDHSPGTSEDNDPTKAHLYVNTYSGGFGSQWLEAAASRFESQYAEHSFIEGTSGVKVHINAHKSAGSAILEAMDVQTDDVFFNEQGFYYSAATSGKLLDISDIVKENLSEKYGEDKTILSKYTSTQREFFTVDGKVYGIPHYSGYFGISYDIDLFESKNFYYADEPTTSTGLISNKTQKRSKGPDGIYNTEDDGLPTTYDELFALCDVMVKRGVTPFCYGGQVRGDYLNSFLSALYIDAEGYEQGMLNFDFGGTPATRLVKSLETDDSGKILSVEYEDATAIDNSNGYMLMKQAGRAYALSFLNRLTSNIDYYDQNTAKETTTHTAAQLAYLQSSLEGRPIAFLLDGIYWENEAQTSGAYDQLVGAYGEKASSQNRNFGWMPLPKPEKDWPAGANLYDYLYTFAFINANIAENKIDLAKSFLQFCYTDKSLVEFTVLTNTPKALSYEIEKSALDKMTTFGRSIISLKNKETTKVVYPYSLNDMYLNNQSGLNLQDSWRALVDGKSKTYAVDAFKKDAFNAKDYFTGLSAFRTQKEWQANYGKWF